MKARKWVTVGLLGVMLYQNVLPTYQALAAEDVQTNIATVTREELNGNRINEPDARNNDELFNWSKGWSGTYSGASFTQDFRRGGYNVKTKATATGVYGVSQTGRNRYERVLFGNYLEFTDDNGDTETYFSSFGNNDGSNRGSAADSSFYMPSDSPTSQGMLTMYQRSEHDGVVNYYKKVVDGVQYLAKVSKDGHYEVAEVISMQKNGEIRHDIRVTNQLNKAIEDYKLGLRVNTHLGKLSDPSTHGAPDSNEIYADGSGGLYIENDDVRYAIKPISNANVYGGKYNTRDTYTWSEPLSQQVAAADREAGSKITYGEIDTAFAVETPVSTLPAKGILEFSFSERLLSKKEKISTAVINYVDQDGEVLGSAQFTGIVDETFEAEIKDFGEFYTYTGSATANKVTLVDGGSTIELPYRDSRTKVTIDPDNGSSARTTKYAQGEKIVKPADPYRNGYTFRGWFNGDTEWDFENGRVGATKITLKAKWSVLNYDGFVELYEAEVAKDRQKENYSDSSWKNYVDRMDEAKTLYDKGEGGGTSNEYYRATNNLRSAIRGLQYLGRDKLAELIAEEAAKDRQEADYTTTSWATYDEALAQAQAVIDNAQATDEAIDEAKDNLMTAIAGLRLQVQADLQAYIDGLDLKEADYSAGSWANYQTALTAAETVADKEGATAAEVSAAKTALETAIGNLIPKELGTLQELVAEEVANDRKKADYSEATWEAYEEALTDAKAMAEAATASKTEILAMIDTLNEAIGGLRLFAQGELATLIEAEEASGKVQADYTVASWTEYSTALTEAKAIVDEGGATKEAVEAAIKALKDGSKNLVLQAYADLSALVTEETEMAREEADYSAESFAAYEEKLAAAETLLNSNNPTKASLETALNELETAIDDLQPMVKANLEALIDAEVAENRVETDYEAGTWATYSAALAEAIRVRDAADSEFDDYKTARSNLQEAIDGLEFLGKPALEQLLEAEKARQEEDYTVESWSAYKEVLDEATGIFEDENSEPQDYVDAKEALEAAIDALVLKVWVALDEEVAKEDARNLVASDYTTATWSTYETALNAAKSLLEDSPTDGDALAAGLSNLTTASEALVKTPQAQLKDAIVEANELEEGNYKPESWTQFQEELVEITAVANDDSKEDADYIEAMERLETAIAALDKSDIGWLNHYIELAESLEARYFTEESWGELLVVLAEAKEVSGKNAPTEEEIKTAEENLLAKIVGLKDSEIGKLKLLLNKESETEYDHELYTEASWEEYVQSISAATILLDSEETTNEEAKDAADRILAAVENFELSAKGLLKELVETEQTTPRDDSHFTSGSWNVYEAALEAGAEIIDENTATMAEYEAALTTLEDAIASLVLIEWAELNELVNAEVAEERNRKDYTTATWEVYAGTLDAAVGWLEADMATAEELSAAQEALESAIEGLELSTLGKLKELVKAEQAEAREAMDYTTTTFTAYETALNAAVAVIADEDAEAEAIETALDKLNDAIDSLKFSTKGELRELIRKEEEKQRNEFDYQADEWIAYATALDNAKNAVEDAEFIGDFEALQATLETAIEELEQNLSPLGLAKKALADLYNKEVTEKRKEADFTVETWAVYQAAMADAKEMIANPVDNLEETQAMINQLNNAIDGLEVSSFQVSFDSNGGSKVASVGVKKDGKLPVPTAPTRKNHTFAGWYTDKSMKTKFNFNTPITKDMTLYAKWTPWMSKTVSVYSSVTNKNYAVWGDLNFKTKKTTTKSLHGRTLHVRGQYNHKNGSVYHSVHNNKGQLIGFVNKKALTHSAHKGGTHWKNGKYVTVTSKNFTLWNDLNFKKTRMSSSKVFNQTFHAKIHYNHYNGYRYYSLYNNKGKWVGYLNVNGAKQASNAGGVAIKNGKRVTIRKSSWAVWNDLNFKKRNNTTTRLRGNSYTARYHYNHHNGRRYLSLYNSRGNWIGYVNEDATK